MRGCLVQSRKTTSVLAAALLFCGLLGPGTAPPATGGGPACRPAELFATDNTTDGFELPAVATIALTGTVVTGSTLVDGVFWSNERQQIGYERSREFHLCVVDAPTLHNAAEALHRQFNQEAVLTFDYLPQNAPEADAILITVPASPCPTSASPASAMPSHLIWLHTTDYGADLSPQPTTP